MTRLMVLVLPIVWMLGGCLPNPQSEWTSSEGGSQRSTLVDPTILAQSTAPPGFFDFDWGYAFSFSQSDGERGDGARAREHAHPTVGHSFGAMGGEHRATSRSSGGGGSSGGGARRR
jgi:hypothetical protein